MKNENWTGNCNGAEGARMISEGLKSNSTLTELNLECDENEEWMDKENRDQNDRNENENEQGTILEMKEREW